MWAGVNQTMRITLHFGLWHKGFFGYMHRSRLANVLNLKFCLYFFIQKIMLYFGCSKEPSHWDLFLVLQYGLGLKQPNQYL